MGRGFLFSLFGLFKCNFSAANGVKMIDNIYFMQF
uniref:Uncharacterized protein n=1 Tax=Rhizophora mucronata TaxID=61149 RepID=A0A2P2NEU1_RHIMU